MSRERILQKLHSKSKKCHNPNGAIILANYRFQQMHERNRYTLSHHKNTPSKAQKILVLRKIRRRCPLEPVELHGSLFSEDTALARTNIITARNHDR